MSRAQLTIFTMLFMLVLALVPHGSAHADDYVNPYANAQVRNGQVSANVGGSVRNGIGSSANQALQPINNTIQNTTRGVTDAANNVIQPVNNVINNTVSGVTDGVNNLLGFKFPGFKNEDSKPIGTAATFSNIKKLDEICKFKVKTSEGLNIISKSVECFEVMFMDIVTEKLIGMTDFMREAVFACMVLYVIFYGIKTSTGMVTEQRARGEFFVHAIKIAFVSWMIMNYGILELWFLTIDLYNAMLDLVLVVPDLNTCPVAAKTVGALWLTMDCILTEFIGWNAEHAGGQVKGVPLLFGMFQGALSMGAGGTLVAMLVFMSILTLVMSLMRVAFVYILSMMGLILAFMISPIMIPFMLFPQTKPMFDGWWKLIVSMVMQPVIIFAYLSFMLSIITEIITGPGGLTELFEVSQPQQETAGVRNTGTATSITSVFTIFNSNKTLIGSDGQSLVPQQVLVYNMLSIFVISYLLSSFTSFVGTMAVELSGNALSPDLSSGVPGFLGGGRG